MFWSRIKKDQTLAIAREILGHGWAQARSPWKKADLAEAMEKAFSSNTEAVMGQHGLMNQLRKRVVEAMLDGELTNHLGYAPHDPAGHETGNSRNEYTAKKVQSKDGVLELEVPRDRNGSFEPQVLRKG